MNCKNDEQIQQAVKKAVEMTFMNMAFIDVMETESISEIHYSHIIHITFSQPVAGGMILYLPMECKKSIVENIHGSTWESLSTDEIDDCLLEVLNVLAGNFLNQYCGKTISHNMSFPEILFDETEVPEKADFVEVYFDAEGVGFKIGICVSESVL